MPHPDSGHAELLERFRRWLRDQRLPVTRPRDVIAELVIGSAGHESVGTIAAQLKARGERVGTATIYRTLDLLVQSGIVRANEFGEGFRRFERAAGKEHHEHIVLRDVVVAVLQDLDALVPVNLLDPIA